ncbi:MAG: hypothetical protein K6T85_02160 [Gorillibacterium sp.]|nr:hypothetical protein [Gorillibacterium sp.]
MLAKKFKLPIILLAFVVIAVLSYQLGRHIERGSVLPKQAEAGIGTPLQAEIATPTPSTDPQQEVVASSDGLLPSDDQVLAKKIYFPEYTKIDGGIQSIPKVMYYLQIEDEKFLSERFLQENYQLDKLQSSPETFLIKGFPLEGKFLYKTSGILPLQPYYEKLLAAFEKQSDSMVPAVLKLDGLAFYWGEVGLEDLVISKPLYMTTRGIAVGSTRQEVQRAYGRLGQDTENRWYTYAGSVEYMEGGTTTFVFENDKVVEIHYGWYGRTEHLE